MAQEQTQEEIAAFITRFPTLITYVPLRTEVDFRRLLPSLPNTVYEIKPRASLDPVAEATRAIEIAKEGVVVLIPGRRFDATGTRHGQGGGWYDRFLGAVPPSWIRMGFCYDDQFSQEPLTRQSWDQPVDYIVVVPRGGDPVLHTMGARN